MVDLSIVMLVYQRVLCILGVSENADVFFFRYFARIQIPS